ncbi:hypothetical protein GCM10019059_42780 [Camelimonas fluminis]|nr:hypothetical protein GCM10019059_42780 [Camelimonas fluminis]
METRLGYFWKDRIMGPTHEKLEKILPLINSSYEGEAHSAFLAIRRCLQSDGFELADVIRAGAHRGNQSAKQSTGYRAI